MSKARLVITAVTIEKRPVSEVARSYGVARSWIYTLLARYRAEGGGGLGDAAAQHLSDSYDRCASCIGNDGGLASPHGNATG